jgi:cytochrome c oxidase subunit 2
MKGLSVLPIAIGFAAIVLVGHWLGQQAYGWLAPPASLEAEQVGHLFSFMVTLASVIVLGVLVMMLVSVVAFRARTGDHSDGPAIRGHPKLEVTWTVIPILLVTWISGYSFMIYQRMDLLGSMPLTHRHDLLMGSAQAQPRETGPGDPAGQRADPPSQPLPEPIDVIASQWHWRFHYPDGDVSSDTLHLPLNQRVHLRLSSTDVLHGFYVPNFRIKQDIVPGRTIGLRFTPNRIGTYTLQDSQFSGTYFALMRADVIVESPQDYGNWLARLGEREPMAIPDAASREHEVLPSSDLPMRSGWPTVPPATPPPIHPSS